MSETPQDEAATQYDRPFFPNAQYDRRIPSQRDLVGFDSGERAASSEEIVKCLQAWTTDNPRALLVEYARSHEGRPLHYVVITSPANHARLDAIRSGMDHLANPEGLSDADGERLIAELPAIAWLAYTIHGDETEGSDAALAVMYHLLADTSPATEKLLDEMVVIIDPVMNPDGRDRYVKMVAEHRGALPDLDDQSLLHNGYWPRGRGNHYLFDLNRDWILGVHPETRGRIREVGRWHPLLFVDAHGMGSQDTHLFSPPRAPFNPHRPASRHHWAEIFLRDHAAAFDRMGWLYYQGEWNEEWYPGYSDSWAAYRGAVGILYEQASISADGLLRPEGRVLTYRESVHHHVVGSMTNLETLRQHARDRLRDFWEEHRAAVSTTGPYANRTFAILPTRNHARWNRFLDLMLLQGIKVHQTTDAMIVPVARDPLGRERMQVALPAGTLLIPNRQPRAHLAAAMLEFDTHLPDDVLKKEREEILKNGRSRIYDVTAWSLCLLYGLDAVELPMDIPRDVPRVTEVPRVTWERHADATATIALVLDGASDDSVTAAARLMERGVEVRVARKPFELQGQAFSRGSIVVTQLDNRAAWTEAMQRVEEVARDVGIPPLPIASGLGTGDLPDLGGAYFTRLEPPRIALLGRGGASPYDYGSIWYLLDHYLRIPHTRIDEDGFLDARAYNVLVLPDRFRGSLPDRLRRELETWVRDGGTLIAVGSSAADLARVKDGISRCRLLPDVLDQLDDYRLAVLREWMAREVQLPEDTLWAHTAATDAVYPWDSKAAAPATDELKKRDRWNQQFMPQGAIVAAQIDPESWLTAGQEGPLPVMISQPAVLMSSQGIETAARLGVWLPGARSGEPTSGTGGGAADRYREVGWSVVPREMTVYLRMGGLLWPEAARRLTNAAYVTRESVGRGQIILFAAPPAFRASTPGTTRLLLNAMVLGPGCGTQPPLRRGH